MNSERATVQSDAGKSDTSKAKSENKIKTEYHIGRLIVRNLQYDIREKHLIKNFAKYGQIIDVSVPLNPENNLNKGFGFVEFKSKEEAQKAIKEMNGQKYKGRLVSVDFALSKQKYDSRVQKMNKGAAPAESKFIDSISFNRLEPDEAAAPKTEDKDNEDWEISSLEEERKAANPESAKPKTKDTKPKVEKVKPTKPVKPETSEAKTEEVKPKKRDAKLERKIDENDASKGQSLFIRNIDYSATEEDLREFFSQYGDLIFVRLVRSKDNPDVHKGTAFVKFKLTDPVDKLAHISNEYWSKDKTKESKAYMANLESQLEFKGRRLAMFKAETKSEREQNIKLSQEKKDKRNLDYVKLGLVTTKEFVHTGVSQTDMDTRVRLFKEKQKSLKNNPNLFISKTRLCIRNIDKRMNEKQLNEFCMSFCNDWKETLPADQQQNYKKNKMIVQLKILRSTEETDENGKPKSTGIGFIEV